MASSGALDDPWRRMCDLADLSALGVAFGAPDPAVEGELVCAMVLAEREATGVAGLAAVHHLRTKVLGDVAWKDAHRRASLYYDGAARTLVDSLRAVVADVYGAPGQAGPVLARQILGLVERLGTTDTEAFALLDLAFDALNARGMTSGAREVAWRIVGLDRAYSRYSGRTPVPYLRWLQGTSLTDVEYREVVVALERLAISALTRRDPWWLIEAAFAQQDVLDEPYAPALQALVDGRLASDFADDVHLRQALNLATIRLQSAEGGDASPGGR